MLVRGLGFSPQRSSSEAFEHLLVSGVRSELLKELLTLFLVHCNFS